MNNSLKLFFLIFHLVPSLTSSVNNFSQPFSETELKMAKNVSEVVKRDSLYGGMKVDGMTYSTPQTCQRPCTLSFPVSEKRFSKKVLKGFLTSANCANTNILVGDTAVGVAVQPHKFDSEQGLDYAFVRVYSEFWSENDVLSDNNSNEIAYSHCAKSGRGIVEVDEPLPIIPTPSQPLSVGDKVYAHGGESGMVSGKVLATGVTITVTKPGSCGKETEQFHDVVKVKMNKSYLQGDLGAPVYIPLQIPGSTQMIASPVGQVVEHANWDYSPSYTWYYIPLDRILKDGELKLESGDLSYLLPKTKKPNDENLTDVPLADNLTTSSNVSEVASNQFDKRQLLQIKAGQWIGVTHDPRELRDDDKRCTLGFAVRKESWDESDHGFLILGSCLSTDTINQRNGVFFLRSPLQSGVRNTRIGTVDTSDLVYRRFFGLNYAVVKLLPNNNRNTFWDDFYSTMIKFYLRELPQSSGFAQVVDEHVPLQIGTRVCATTGYSHTFCGTIVSLRAGLSSMNPWRLGFLGTIRRQILGVSPVENWLNLIKVRLEGIPRAYRDRVIGNDYGSPVYWVVQNNLHGLKVAPVGLLYDYVSEDVGNRCELFMYCVKITEIWSNNPNLHLIEAPVW